MFFLKQSILSALCTHTLTLQHIQLSIGSFIVTNEAVNVWLDRVKVIVQVSYLCCMDRRFSLSSVSRACSHKSFSKGDGRLPQTVRHKLAPVSVNEHLSPLMTTDIYCIQPDFLPHSWQFVSCSGTGRQISESWDNAVGGPGAGQSPHEWAALWGALPAYQAYRGFLPGFLQSSHVITVAGWLCYSMCISQHSQCFPCVVSFPLYSDSLKLCAL